MKNKIALAVSSVAVAIGAIVVGSISIGEGYALVPAGAGNGAYSLSLSSTSDLSNVRTSLNNQVTFASSGYTNGTFSADGFVRNTSEILATTSVNVVVSNGTIGLYKSWDGTTYYDTEAALTSSSGTYTFTDSVKPGYFKLIASSAASLTSFVINYNCGSAHQDAPANLLEFPVDYNPGKVYDATAASAPVHGSGTTVAWYSSTDNPLEAAPSVVGSYKVKLTDGTGTISKDFSITDYTTDIIENEPGVKVTMTVNGKSFLKKGESGELICNGWWVKLNFVGAIVPVGATGIVLHVKAAAAATGLLYECSYPGTFIGSGTIAAIGTEYSSVTLPITSNFCQLEAINILSPNNQLTIDKISFSPVSTLAIGKTNIFGLASPIDITADGTTMLMNDPADDSLALTHSWWAGFTVASGVVSIPKSSTKINITMKANVAENVLLQVWSQNETLYPSSKAGVDVTTSFATYSFAIAPTVDSSLRDIQLCVCDNGSGYWRCVAISSITFA